MSDRKDDRPLKLEDVPVEEGITGEDAAEQLARSPEDARHERERTDDSADDPAHSADEDEGWISEGGATPSGPATDVGQDP